MSEAEYWGRLEYRICREFAAMQNWDLRHYWCDGLIPQHYHLKDSEPRITGQAWICYGQRQQEWKFTLFLPEPAGSQDEVDWASLLPPDNVTRWLAVDPASKRIEIEPAAAIPDPAGRGATGNPYRCDTVECAERPWSKAMPNKAR